VPLIGRRLVAAMCVGQVGNLLPHVVVPGVMTKHLIPLWNSAATEAGLMASSFTASFVWFMCIAGITATAIAITLNNSPECRHE
jgi:hypothetical protein